MKALGQHFLRDKNIVNQIVNFVNPSYDIETIEVGPGLGALTYPVSKKTKMFTVIEIDKNLIIQLKNNKNIKLNLNIINKNIMHINLDNFFINFKNPVKIFGSLPYNISTQLIYRLIKKTKKIFDMHFVLQKEVAERIIAKPNSKHYGYMSIIVQYYCFVEKLLEISKKSFIPIPKVESTLVRFIPRKKYAFPYQNLKICKILIKTAFNQRRKILKNSLSKYISIADFAHVNINPYLRAENLSIKNYYDLSKIYSLNKKIN
ncbi:MAG: 16S rRNA (adenine(1518)-N(6)/adenine(1519)-N(6))-dimethyltransferase RsmA [Wigglesworthia glossinidia]|nr:16S rRNA (adenine(1518)-N(6)/adenine(1519)-N(6))-dimethyltransferase RsmA [Wigglesworthia glossinidia]